MNRHDDDPGPVPGLSGLRLDQPPGRDLWPGIQARLRPRRSRWVDVSRAAIAASLVAGIALAVISRVQQSSPGAEAPAAAEPQIARTPAVIEDQDRALVHANLQIVDSAEQQLRHALEQDPESRSLQRLLTATQAQRRDLRKLLSNTA